MMKKLFLISFLFIFIISCQSQATITPTSINLTNTPESTSTPTQSPTLVPTATQTTTIEFPDWVKNPDTQILLVPVGTHEKGYENMALFNAETGERFDVPFTKRVGDYFWMPDGSAFGFLLEDNKKLILFSILDDSITITNLSEEPLRFYYTDSYSNPIQVPIVNVNDANFLILPSRYTLSPDKRFFVYQEKYDETYTSIFDVETNQLLYLSDPNDGFFDLDSQFSPNSQFLAIVEVDEMPEMWNTFQVLPTFRLRVYDVESQQVVTSYKNVTFPNWSPDGTKFLFQEWKKQQSGWYWYAESPPCVYNTVDGTTKCYKEVIDHHNKPTTIQAMISSISWSPNQDLISYISYNVDQNPHSEYGSFCMISMLPNELKCILEEFDIEGQKIINYIWSPNSSFIVFEYDTSCPYCDYSDSPQVGIANVLTGEYFSIGRQVSFFDLGLWRPSPNP